MEEESFAELQQWLLKAAKGESTGLPLKDRSEVDNLAVFESYRKFCTEQFSRLFPSQSERQEAETLHVNASLQVAATRQAAIDGLLFRMFQALPDNAEEAISAANSIHQELNHLREDCSSILERMPALPPLRPLPDV